MQKKKYLTQIYPLMKLSLFCVTGILLLAAGPAQKVSSSVKHRLCKNWIAYETEYQETTLSRKIINPVDANHYDTLLLHLDGTYYRHSNNSIYQGRWVTNADSTLLIIPPGHPVHKGAAIQELTDSILQLAHSWGKEGEKVITKYRLLERE
jgi:hypothetical protein